MNISYLLKLSLDILFIFIFASWTIYSFKNKKGMNYKALTILFLTSRIDSTLESFSGNIYNYLYLILYVIQCISLLVIIYNFIKSIWSLIRNFNKDKIKIEY